VGEAATGREALAVFREFRPDLVVLDLSMPGLGGLEVIPRLRIENPAIRILVLSMHQEAIYARRALQAGGPGFVGKSAAPERLLDAIRRVAAGGRYIEHEIAQELALAGLHAAGQPLHALTPREFEILRLLGEGSGLRPTAGRAHARLPHADRPGADKAPSRSGARCRGRRRQPAGSRRAGARPPRSCRGSRAPPPAAPAARRSPPGAC